MIEIACRAVLFDCDGVLVDSKDSGNRSWSRWATEHSLDPAVVLHGVHGRRSAETVALFLPEAARAAGVAAIDGLEIDDAGGTNPIAGAPELLAALPGNFAVITSATRPLLRARIGAAGLTLPPTVVTAEDVEHEKPAPEGYLLAGGRLGAPIGDYVVVEDSLTGIRAGRAAGAGFVLGVGDEAVASDADQVVRDLRACTWTGAGLAIDPAYLLR